MNIVPLSPRVEQYLKHHRLNNKFQKQLKLLEADPKYPSLNIERLEPKSRGIYSFRIDLKFRALFIFRDDLNAIEILAITNHYR